MKESAFREDGRLFAHIRTRMDRLTNSEMQVLVLLVNGVEVQEVAARMGISLRMFETHMFKIIDKLDLQILPKFADSPEKTLYNM